VDRPVTDQEVFAAAKAAAIHDVILGFPKGYNTLVYRESEVSRISKVAFDIAMKRNKRLCSVDKANVLECTEMWREVVTAEAANWPEVELSHMYVDNAAMQLVRAPKQFDVMVTTNMFGDILSDCAAMLTGSIGMGKTTAAMAFRSLGVFVHDADKAVHSLMAPGGGATAAVLDAFPGVEKDGGVDRKALGALVFGKPAKLQQLEIKLLIQIQFG